MGTTLAGKTTLLRSGRSGSVSSSDGRGLVVTMGPYLHAEDSARRPP